MTVKVADALMDADEVSVPTIVTMYVPFAAFVGVGVEGAAEVRPVPVHPDAAKPITAKRQIAAIAPASLPEFPARKKNKRAASMRPAVTPKFVEDGAPGRPAPSPKPASSPPRGPAPELPAEEQADESVLTVRAPVAAALLEITRLAMEKQPFVREGLLVTAHEIVPVYPFCGVTVTVEEPELPAATVTFDADSVNDLPSTVMLWLPLEDA